MKHTLQQVDQPKNSIVKDPSQSLWTASVPDCSPCHQCRPHRLSTQHEAEVGCILESHAANEGGTVHGVFWGEDAARQQAVAYEGRDGVAVDSVHQQVVLPLPEQLHTFPPAILHPRLLPFQKLDVFLGDHAALRVS